MEHQQIVSSSTSKLSQATSKKPPPLHKRHTKPCKYYQINRCPYSADACNFAHVIAPPPVKEGKSDAAMCRHYAVGTCPNGHQCRFRHQDDREVPPPYKPDVLRVTIPESQGGWHGMAHPTHDKAYYDQAPSHGPGFSPYYTHHPHEWSYANGITAHSPVYVYRHPAASGPPHAVTHPRAKDRHQGPMAGMGASPPFTISTSCDHSSATANHYGPHTHYGSDQDDGLSTGSSSSISSASPSTELDELIIATTVDPKFTEHAHEHQSQVLIGEYSGITGHIPPTVVQHPFYPGGPRVPGLSPQGTQQPQPHPLPVLQHQGLYYRTATPARYGSVTPRSGPSNPASRSASRNSHRVKSSKYKTKPCKYWAVDGTCPSGDECTFRHDEPYPPPVPPLPPNLDQLPSPPRHQLLPKVQSDQALLAPPGLKKDVSQSSNSSTTSDNSKKDGFVPIGWRVIGGGVRIGNPYNTCTATSSQSSESHCGTDSIFASESEDQERIPGGPDSSFAESGECGERGLGLASSSELAGDHELAPILSALGVSEVAGNGGIRGREGVLKAPEYTDAGGRDRAGSGASASAGSGARKRSNSIPPTPSSTQFIVGNLFSAESPGVL